MEVTVAKTAGFCFGVKRAVEKVYDQIGRTEKRIYTYGPIIHNEQVVGDLREKGVEVIDSLEELKTIRNAVVVIRSHGVGKSLRDLKRKRCGDRGCHMSLCEKDPPDRRKTVSRRKKSHDHRQ